MQIEDQDSHITFDEESPINSGFKTIQLPMENISHLSNSSLSYQSPVIETKNFITKNYSSDKDTRNPLFRTAFTKSVKPTQTSFISKTSNTRDFSSKSEENSERSSKLFDECLGRIFQKKSRKNNFDFGSSGRTGNLQISKKNSILVQSNQIESHVHLSSSSHQTNRMLQFSSNSRPQRENSDYTRKNLFGLSNSSIKHRTDSSGIPSNKKYSEFSKSKSLTLGSTIGRTPRNAYAPEYIVSITENRATEVGIATFNVNTGEIVITQISDNHTYLNTCKIIL